MAPTEVKIPNASNKIPADSCTASSLSRMPSGSSACPSVEAEESAENVLTASIAFGRVHWPSRFDAYVVAYGSRSGLVIINTHCSASAIETIIPVAE